MPNSRLQMCETRGKRGAKVFIMFTEDMVKSIDLILEFRDKVGSFIIQYNLYNVDILYHMYNLL
jgi:hypothetical protein